MSKSARSGAVTDVYDQDVWTVPADVGFTADVALRKLFPLYTGQCSC